MHESNKDLRTYRPVLFQYTSEVVILERIRIIQIVIHLIDKEILHCSQYLIKKILYC